MAWDLKTYVLRYTILADFKLIICNFPIKPSNTREKMNKTTKERAQEPKEFTATDVKNIYKSVDEKNGFHIDFIINKFRTRMKQESQSNQEK